MMWTPWHPNSCAVSRVTCLLGRVRVGGLDRHWAERGRRPRGRTSKGMEQMIAAHLEGVAEVGWDCGSCMWDP
jgi:hypothetical protein